MLKENKDELIKIPIIVEDMSIKREYVFVKLVSSNEYILKSIPAFAYGVAYNDTVSIIDIHKGIYKVLTRGGNVTIRLYRKGTLNSEDIDNLISKVVANDGLYEIGKNVSPESESSLLLISLPVSIGFSAIENIMELANKIKSRWEYGNVYDKDGEPLGWWK